MTDTDDVVEETDQQDIVKASAEYGDAYKEAVAEVIEGMGLPGDYTKQLLDKIHAIALPKAGGVAARNARASAASDEDVGSAVNDQEDNTAPEKTPAVPQSAPAPEVTDQVAEPKDEEEDTKKVTKDSEEVTKVTHPKQDAPVTEGSWDGNAAAHRLLIWAGGPDKENVDWQKYGKGFLYHDSENADNAQGYKFPVADIVNGKFTINRGALAAAAGRINQTKGIPPDELDRMKSTLRSYYKDIGERMPLNIIKDVESFVGKEPLVMFVAASPGITEVLRKSALVGPTGRVFNGQYLEPLNLTRNDIAITYLVPHLLKDSTGKVREPTVEEIKENAEWLTQEMGAVKAPMTIALGHTVKKALGRSIDFTLPHPNALGTARTSEELQRKRLQVEKALQSRYPKRLSTLVGKKQ